MQNLEPPCAYRKVLLNRSHLNGPNALVFHPLTQNLTESYLV